MTKIQCPNCNTFSKLSNELSKKSRVRCSVCKHVFVINTHTPVEAISKTLFISHATNNRDRVEREIIGPLQASGMVTWYGPESIQGSEKWERKILEGIKKCDLFVLVMTKDSAKSEYVRDEIDLALRFLGDHRIIPLLLEDCDSADFHIRLNRIQYIDYRSRTKQSHEQLMSVILKNEFPSKPTLIKSRIGKNLTIWTTIVFTALLIVIAAFFVWPKSDDAHSGNNSTKVIIPEVEKKYHSYKLNVRFVNPIGRKITWLSEKKEPKLPTTPANAKSANNNKPSGLPPFIDSPLSPPYKLAYGFIRPQPKIEKDLIFTVARLETPARYIFDSGGRYRLRLSHIPNRPGKTYYPSLEIRDSDYPDYLESLTTNPLQLSISDEVFDSVNSGKEYVCIWYAKNDGYIKSSEFIDNAGTPNSALESKAGGTLLVVFRMTMIDFEDPNTPAPDP
jgi:TIR domain